MYCSHRLLLLNSLCVASVWFLKRLAFTDTRKGGALRGALPPLVKCINKLYSVRFKVDNGTLHKIDWFGMSKLFKKKSEYNAKEC